MAKEKITFRFSVGEEVTETVTGFTGVVTGQFHYLNGCKRYLLEGKVKDPTGKPEELVYDEDRLEKTPAKKAAIAQTPTGGPPSSSAPARQRSG